MNEEKKQSKENVTKQKRPKHRSPNFPSYSLEKAIEKVKEIFDVYKMTTLPERIACEIWTYAPNGSQGQLCIAALKAFGLIQIEGTGKDKKITVSESARRLILKDNNYNNLLKEAALSPPLHKELWNHYEGFIPENDELFRKFLLIEKRFNDKSVDSFIAQFRATIALASLEKGDKILPDSGSEDKIVEPETPINAMNYPPIKPNINDDLRKKMKESTQNTDFRELKFFLPSGDAHLFIPSSMDEDDFEILATFIDAHKRAMQKASTKKQKHIDSEENK